MKLIEISSWYIVEEIAEGSLKTNYIIIYVSVMLTTYQVNFSDDKLKSSFLSR